MLARQISRLRASFILPQNPNDLLFREPASVHPSVPQSGRTLNYAEENLSGMCGRPPRVKDHFDVTAAVGCSHVFGLFVRRS